ncbi:hypothetical protein [Pseudomonas sp.]|uniref:hypothetical protein n=1 Tax=Pseudomonas sp. TaxID=306 RepID=UPI0035661A45
MKHCPALSTGASLIASLLLATPVQAQTARLTAEGYRLSRYRSATPDQTGHDDRGGPLVFNCRSNCRPGRNALKRAHPLGYNNLYRKRIDGWQQAGLPPVRAQPLVPP